MRNLKRRVGKELAAEGEASGKAPQVRGAGDRVLVEAPRDKRLLRDDILEQLSAAAREALKPPDSAGGC